MKKSVKIALWFLVILIVGAGAVFSVGYFYYSDIIRNYLVESVKKQTNGLYTAEIGDLSLDIIRGNLAVENFHLKPDTVLYKKLNATDTMAPLLIDFRIDEFRIKGFKVMDAWKKKRIEVRQILFASPEVMIYRMKQRAEKSKEEPGKEKMMSIPLPAGLTGIDIREIDVENARLSFSDHLGDSVVTRIFPKTDIHIRGILVDSAHTGKRRLFNADDIRINLGSYSLKDKKEMNKISFGEIGISTASETVFIKDFHLEPLYNQHDYSRKLGYQADRTEVKIAMLKLERLHIRQLLFEGKFVAGLLTIDSLLIDDYRDMRVPALKGVYPPMPHQAIRKLKTYLKIDTVRVRNGKAIYAEQVMEKPGSLFFDRINATLTNLTNDSVLLAANVVTELRGEAYFMGEGKLDVTIRLFPGDKASSFTYSAQIGPMDLTKINSMLSYQIPGKIESGQLKKLVIPFVKANDNEAAGTLIFYYNNLKIMVDTKDATTWGKIKQGAINFAANDIILNNDNPTKKGKLKTGTIYFQRNKESSIFNFLWKSIFSGLKSTIGINNEVQKSMIKEEKHRKKR